MYRNSYIYIYNSKRIVHVLLQNLHFRNLTLELGSASDTSVNWRNYVRSFYAEYFLKHLLVICGEGHMAEMDKSLFAHRKYDVGKLGYKQWVLADYTPPQRKPFWLLLRPEAQ